MFSSYEALKCDTCTASFVGRKPAEGVKIHCPDCLANEELPAINEGDDIPDTVHEANQGREN